MQQLTFIRAGQPLEWLEVPTPTLQGPDEALVRPVAVASCDLDYAVVRGLTPYQGPFAFGHEFIAEVIEAGSEVIHFKPGQIVVVPFQISCGKCSNCLRGLTGSCKTAQAGSMYGLPIRGGWGGALSDLVRVPFAEAMLLPVPPGVSPQAIASVSDNLSDAWRTVGPYLEKNAGATILIAGGAMAGSIGLYAVAIAQALGASQIDYVDKDLTRLEKAKELGANPRQLKNDVPKRFGSYPITVDSAGEPLLLEAVLRSTEAGGTCTSTAIYFEPVALPLLEMYTTGITFKTSRVHSRATTPKVLELIRSGRLHPETVTTEIVPWMDAGEAFLTYHTKLIITC